MTDSMFFYEKGYDDGYVDGRRDEAFGQAPLLRERDEARRIARTLWRVLLASERMIDADWTFGEASAEGLASWVALCNETEAARKTVREQA